MLNALGHNGKFNHLKVPRSRTHRYWTVITVTDITVRAVVASVTIHLEDFQRWSEVFVEIERQKNMRLFKIMQPNPFAIHYRETKKQKSFLQVL